MATKLSDELKAAILALPTKEKDKLLIRLITGNELLREQLHYQLLEDEADLHFRRSELKESHQLLLKDLQGSRTDSLLYYIRKMSAQITWHKKVTKDAYGEVELLVNLLHFITEVHIQAFNSHTRVSDKLRVYIASKVKSTIKNLEKLHEDLQLDFKTNLSKSIEQLNTTELAYEMNSYGMPKSYE